MQNSSSGSVCVWRSPAPPGILLTMCQEDVPPTALPWRLDAPVYTIAVANQKGGVGKTTSAVNLATAFAAVGHRVLLIDLDPQGNASTGLGVSTEERQMTSYQILLEPTTVAQSVLVSTIPNVCVIPSTIDLVGAEVELAHASQRNLRLRSALRRIPSKSFDFVFIDCPPSLNVLVVNALAAANSVLVPLQCEFYALEGLAQLYNTIQIVQRSINPSLYLLGILMTMSDPRTRLSTQVIQDARSTLGNEVLETVIPRNVRLSEAPSHGLPALLYDPGCAGSQSYIEAAREIRARIEESGRSNERGRRHRQ